MSYFAPYIDAAGIHMPTYEERLEELCAQYRSIFGPDAAMDPSVPDYQLLSVFAKSLDDASALVLEAYNSRNPAYASGQALDLLLPQYGLTRLSRETDAEARSRIRNALAGRNGCSPDQLLSAVRNARSVREAKLYVNETDSTDAQDIPPHSIAVVTRGGNAQAIAQAIWDHKAPGIRTWGSHSADAMDAEGNAHTVYFSRYADKIVYIVLFVQLLTGGSQSAVEEAVRPAVLNYVDQMGIAEPLNVPQLYGVAYASNPAIADTYVIRDIQVSLPGVPGQIRDVVACGWKEKITALEDVGVRVEYI